MRHLAKLIRGFGLSAAQAGAPASPKMPKTVNADAQAMIASSLKRESIENLS
jgi:hypothetical protein